MRAAMLILLAELRRAGERDRSALGRGAARGGQERCEAIDYPDVDHAFHNDTSAQRYNAEAAQAAWAATLDFFARRHLERRRCHDKKKARRFRRAFPFSILSTVA